MDRREDDAGDHDFAASRERETGRQHDPPEAELWQADRVREVEHVPGDPEDKRAKQ
jgi:hypothetical protein